MSQLNFRFSRILVYFALTCGLFIVAGLWSGRGSSFEAYLARNPVIARLLEENPVLLPQVKEIFEFVSQGDTEQAAGKMSTLLTQVLPSYFKFAPDNLVVQYGKIYVRYINALEELDEYSCYELVFKKPIELSNQALEFSKKVDPQIIQELVAAQEKVLQEALLNPVSPPSPDTVAPLLKAITKRIDYRTRSLFAAIASGHLIRPEMELACKAQRTYYEQILKLSEDQAGPVLKTLLY